MAEIKVTELPVITLEDFTSNDRFIIIDDGSVRQLTREVFQEWLTANVKGERGEQGVAGRDGLDGKNGIAGAKGTDGLSAYQIAVAEGYTGSKAQWITSLKGATGAKGNNGNNGWTPLLSTESRGDDVVLKVVGWTGGTGTMPTDLGYIGDTGLVTNILNAKNIRGTKGLKGDVGEKGATGATGVAGKSVSTIEYSDDLSVKLTFTDKTFKSTNAPPKKLGYGYYEDGVYSPTNLFRVANGSQLTIPNSGAVSVESLPVGTTSFYNPVSQKLNLSDEEGCYTVTVQFSVSASSTEGYLNLSMNKGLSTLAYSEDKNLRGDGTVQDMAFTATVHGDTALASNGLSIRVKPNGRDINIFGMKITVAKVV